MRPPPFALVRWYGCQPPPAAVIRPRAVGRDLPVFYIREGERMLQLLLMLGGYLAVMTIAVWLIGAFTGRDTPPR